MQKMDKGEIIFHLAIPAIMVAVTFFVGYYVVTLMTNIIKMA